MRQCSHRPHLADGDAIRKPEPEACGRAPSPLAATAHPPWAIGSFQRPNIGPSCSPSHRGHAAATAAASPPPKPALLQVDAVEDMAAERALLIAHDIGAFRVDDDRMRDREVGSL